MITNEHRRLPLAQDRQTEPVTIRASKDVVSGIDAIAAAMDRSRNYIVNQALEQYLAANAWQVDRIRQGIAAARDGLVRPAEDVFAAIAKKHGWTP
jgi:predicted transcriptional regulator